MARNGSGVMSVPYPDFVAGTAISSGQVDANNADIVAEISNSIAADGQTTVTANIPMASHKFTGLSAGSAATDSAHLGQVQAQAYVWCGTAGGTADAITLSPSPAITALAAGMVFRWKAGSSANTGAMTIAVSGLTAVAAQNDGSALAAGDHAANKWYEAVYDGSAFQIRRYRIGGIGDLLSTNNLSDLANAATARTNLGAQQSDATLTSLSGLTLAAGDILYATAADTLTNLAKGTASQQLRMNAGATAPEWFTPSGSSALVPLATATVSGAASLSVDWTNNGYDEVLVELVNVRPDTDATALYFRARQSAADVSSAGAYFGVYENATSTFLDISAGHTIGSASGEYGMSGRVSIGAPGGSSFNKEIGFDVRFVDSSTGNTKASARVLANGGDFRANTSAITGISIYPSSGNITGTLNAYGVKYS